MYSLSDWLSAIADSLCVYSIMLERLYMQRSNLSERYGCDYLKGSSTASRDSADLRLGQFLFLFASMKEFVVIIRALLLLVPNIV